MSGQCCAVGGLDEAALYPTGLSTVQVLNHFNQSGNSRPTAPTNVSAAAGQNLATVSWTASSATGTSVTGYLVESFAGAAVKNRSWVSGGSTSFAVTGLQGGVAYTFQVTAMDRFGRGPTSAVSSAVTPTGATSTYASTVLGDGPSAYYRWEDTAGNGPTMADSSGNGRDGWLFGY